MLINYSKPNEANKNQCGYFKNHTKSYYHDLPEPEEESQDLQIKKRSKSTKGSRVIHNEKSLI